MKKQSMLDTNPFPFSTTNKRYHTWDYHLKETFGEKVFKVSLNAGFTCPNIDGTKKFGGCTFCSIKGSGDYAGNPSDDIIQQFHTIKERMREKWPHVKKYIGYFQAFTNTYAPVDVLKEKFEPILAQEGVVGLSIATRPDCLPDDVVEYLADLNKRTYLWVEMGLQTSNDRTGKRINRAHTFEEYKEGVQKLHAHNIRVCTHIINGLPNETQEDMLQTVQDVCTLGVEGIKIHLLHIIADTPMFTMLKKGMIDYMDRDVYIDTVVQQLERLPQEMIIHRLTGDAPADQFIGPLWSRKKTTVLNDIDKALLEKNTYQGKYYETNSK